MTEERRTDLLSIIQDIALTLMNEEDPKEIDEGLKLIESICRHRVDVRSIQECSKYAVN